MSDDSDLQRMFDAQREFDEGTAPSFDLMHARAGSRVGYPHSLWPKVAAMCVVAALVLFVVFLRDSGPPGENASRVAEDDLERLNQRCESLLVSIRQAEFESTESNDQDLNPQMVWPTITASLMPFETLALDTRTSQ